MKELHWIGRIPTGGLAIAALLLGLAPFHPQPHLVEKVGMLWQGTLSQPVDVFDLSFPVRQRSCWPCAYSPGGKFYQQSKTARAIRPEVEIARDVVASLLWIIPGSRASSQFPCGTGAHPCR